MCVLVVIVDHDIDKPEALKVTEEPEPVMLIPVPLRKLTLEAVGTTTVESGVVIVSMALPEPDMGAQFAIPDASEVRMYAT